MRFLSTVLALAASTQAFDISNLFNAFSPLNLDGKMFHPSPKAMADIMGVDTVPEISNSRAFHEFRSSFLKNVREKTRYFALENGINEKDDTDYPYYRFLPAFEGAVLPGNSHISYKGDCFANNEASVIEDVNNPLSFQLNITSSNPKNALCHEMYLLGTASAVSIQTVPSAGTHSFTFTLPSTATPADLWDAQNKGIRVFRFMGTQQQLIQWLLTTAELFEPEATMPVDDKYAQMNMDFLAKYANVKMVPRATEHVPLDESLIHSGDFLGIIRLDGLDPLLAWGMGSTTGHTTVALRLGSDDGPLNICESTAVGSYWKVNGIQCTPYAEWIQNAQNAGFQVTHAPLTAAMRANFNRAAAEEFFHSVEGYDYGYSTLFWGWIDTTADNYPCLPDRPDICLTWSHLEILFGVIDKLIPSLFDWFVGQAFNHRLGTQGLDFTSLLQEAYNQGMAAQVIPTLPEQDTWLYETTRGDDPTKVQGPSMVCCVFVCHMWKAGGLFSSIDDNINCGELTNFDDYSLNFFGWDNNQRPSACVSADPSNDLCQLEGKYTLQLTNWNTRASFPHYAEKCPSLAPDYIRPNQC